MAYESIIQARPLSDATNTDILRDKQLTLLARYLNAAEVFKCPSDKSYAIRPISGGRKVPRARSYSMNEYVGQNAQFAGNDPRVRYLFTPGDCSIPATDMFLFIDEHEDSIDDGYFLVGIPEVRAIGWEDVPAARHNKSCQLMFIDGHADRHRWTDPRTFYPVTRSKLIWPPQANSKDMVWLFDRAIFLK